MAVDFAVLAMAIFVSTTTKTLMELARISEGGTYARMLVYHYLKGRKDKISSETATNVKRTVSKAMQADLNLKELEFEAEVLNLLPRQMQREAACSPEAHSRSPSFFNTFNVLCPAVLNCICCQRVQLQVCPRVMWFMSMATLALACGSWLQESLGIVLKTR